MRLIWSSHRLNVLLEINIITDRIWNQVHWCDIEVAFSLSHCSNRRTSIRGYVRLCTSAQAYSQWVSGHKGSLELQSSTELTRSTEFLKTAWPFLSPIVLFYTFDCIDSMFLKVWLVYSFFPCFSRPNCSYWMFHSVTKAWTDDSYSTT